MTSITLKGEWKARLDPMGIGLAEGWATEPIAADFTVEVPGCLQQLRSLADAYPPQADMRNGYKGTWFLEKEIELPDMADGEHCVLHLGGAQPFCHVWVNGVYAGKSREPYCPLRLDITWAALSGPNRVTVALVEEVNSTLFGGFRFMGRDWSGLYREAHIDIRTPVWFDGLHIACETDARSVVRGALVNDGDSPWRGEVCINLAGRLAAVNAEVPAHGHIELEIPVDTAGLARWRPDNPALHALTASLCRGTIVQHAETMQVGLRRLHTDGAEIMMDQDPILLLGSGQEYFSPSISPMIDKDLIRRRYEMLQRFGFNFYRCHTFVPTEEELTVADEMGLMISAELSVVSNFHKLTPFDAGLSMLEHYVRLSRRHPSLIIYCLGNEGSQLMVNSALEREHARLGYEAVKRNTTEQLCMIAFGMQGELPELPNDIESPHLWSHNFLWAYEGLTDIPWDALSKTTTGRPCIVHEYGKFGVWPAPRDQEGYPEKGMQVDFADQAHEVLEEMGCAGDEAALIDNSRKLASLCNRIILEEARRQPYVRGYTLWTFFRRAGCNAGLSDDMARYADCDPAIFKDGCNAPVSLLIDRGFQGRALAAGQRTQIGITLSNFGGAAIEGAELSWQIGGRTGAWQVTFPAGKTAPIGKIDFTSSTNAGAEKVILSVQLIQNGQVLARNSWDFWVFATDMDALPETYLYIKSEAHYAQIKRALPGSQRLFDVHSILVGCRSWRTEDITEKTAGQGAVVIADQWDDTAKALIGKGVPVLLINTGHLPEGWFAPPIMGGMLEDDTSRFFSSFRAGWDSGNLATVIRPETGVLGAFPHEGFCDLHFYDMIQRAAPLAPDALQRAVGGDQRTVIDCYTKLRVSAQAEAVVQDPNAAKETKVKRKRTFAARRQSYLVEVKTDAAKMLITSLKTDGHPAGEAMLRQLVRSLAKEV